MKTILTICIFLISANIYSQVVGTDKKKSTKSTYSGMKAKMPSESQIIYSTETYLLKKKNVLIKTPSQSQIAETPKNALKTENKYVKHSLEVKLED